MHDLATNVKALEPATLAIALRARRYQEIRNALAMANSRLVAHIAKRFFNRGISAADLIQEGFCGLMAAIDRFDTANTTRLATYAGWWIRQAMQPPSRAAVSGPIEPETTSTAGTRHGPHASDAKRDLFAEVVPPKKVRSSR